ncbi:MAG: hypothetical protein SF339_14415 [Blastocatellia bacterium]|nr:hypothetical protein [Blastocatellia bacterium]
MVMGSSEIQNEEIQRYLLGRMTDDERANLEAAYFDDDEVFARIQERENDLIDDYRRGRLSTEDRAQFERLYPRHPDRRAHMKFVEALSESVNAAVPAPARPSWAERLRALLPRFDSPLAVAAAAALALLAIGSVWLLVETRRLRQELNSAQMARADKERRAEEARRQLAGQQERNNALNAEVEQLRAQLASPAQNRSDIVSLFLAATGIRGGSADGAPEIVLAADARTVALRIRIKPGPYARYQASIEEVGGREVWAQRNLKARGSIVELSISAARLAAGDYLVLLSGVTAAGEAEEIAQPFFRVRRP